MLDGVSFEARAGRVTALLGANGAGKTTVLRVLLGLARPTSGRATIGGRPLAEHPEPARVAGFAPSGRVGPPGRSAAEQARLVAAVAGLGPDAGARALADVGLGSAARRRGGTYSTGMHRRMALALALLGHPATLVLDSPPTAWTRSPRVGCGTARRRGPRRVGRSSWRPMRSRTRWPAPTTS